MNERQREVTLRFLAEPSHVNFGGNVHGGVVMRWIDQAGYACAVGWSGHYCVTVYVGGIRFHRPVPIGSLIEARARLIYTGTTSMHLAVDLFARDPRSDARTKTTHCIIVFVAVDEQGAPVTVPKWQPTSEEDYAMERYALRLMELRKGIEQEMSPFLEA
jgi:uncharacterized protein (TIGR00369 family)